MTAIIDWVRRGPLVALIGFSLASPAASQNKVFTLGELYALCRSSDVAKQNACTGFVTGVRHTLDVFKNSLKDRVSYCIPNSISNPNFRDGLLGWADKNRGEFERAAVRGVIKSALEMYPCAKGPAKPFEF